MEEKKISGRRSRLTHKRARRALRHAPEFPSPSLALPSYQPSAFVCETLAARARMQARPPAPVFLSPRLLFVQPGRPSVPRFPFHSDLQHTYMTTEPTIRGRGSKICTKLQHHPH